MGNNKDILFTFSPEVYHKPDGTLRTHDEFLVEARKVFSQVEGFEVTKIVDSVMYFEWQLPEGKATGHINLKKQPK